MLAFVADRNEGQPGAADADIFDLQRAPVTWYPDLPLASDGLRIAAAAECTVGTALAAALASPGTSTDPDVRLATYLRR